MSHHKNPETTMTKYLGAIFFLGGTITSHDVKKVSTCLSFSHFTFSALFFKPTFERESLALQSTLLGVESTGIDLAAKRSSFHFCASLGRSK
jgi:hypothetical protein